MVLATVGQIFGPNRSVNNQNTILDQCKRKINTFMVDGGLWRPLFGWDDEIASTCCFDFPCSYPSPYQRDNQQLAIRIPHRAQLASISSQSPWTLRPFIRHRFFSKTNPN
jgi:hypothetical protein